MAKASDSPTLNASDLAKRLKALSDEALEPILKVWIDALGWAPSSRLDDIEEKETYRLTSVLLDRPTAHGFRLWCAAFPITDNLSFNGWATELSESFIRHDWSGDDNYATHHEQGKSALQLALTLKGYAIARPWALGAVVKQELALSAAEKALVGSRQPLTRTPQLILDRVIQAWGVQLKRASFENDLPSNRIPQEREKFAALMSAAWDQVKATARLTGGVIEPHRVFGAELRGNYPSSEAQRWYGEQKKTGWEQAVTLGNHVPLAQVLLNMLHQMPADDQRPILMRWFDTAAKAGALPILDLLCKQTPVLDLPVVRAELSNQDLFRRTADETQSLRDHVAQVAQHPRHQWHPESVSWLTGHQRLATLAQTPAAPAVHARPRRRS